MNGKHFGTVACTALLKTLLLAFNLIFFALGLAFLIIGIYGFKVFTDFFSFAPSKAIYIPIICIGVIMMVSGILSLWCTPKGVSWLLYIYALGIFILFLAIFSTSLFFMTKRDAFESTLRNGIVKSLDTYPKDASIDFLQSTIKCCGVENYNDWFKTNWSNSRKMVPESCCILPKNCIHEQLPSKNATDIWQQGCFNKVYLVIERNYALIGGICFASSVFVLFGSILACILAKNLNKHRYETME